MKSTLGAGSFIRHNSAMLTRLHKYAQPLAFHPSRFSSPFGNEIEDVHDYGFKRVPFIRDTVSAPSPKGIFLLGIASNFALLWVAPLRGAGS